MRGFSFSVMGLVWLLFTFCFLFVVFVVLEGEVDGEMSRCE